MVPPIAFAISWKKEKECLLELRLRWKLWEAVFHRPYGCKNKWCLYKDLGSEKTVIKQELRSLSSPLLSSYRRQKPSKPLLLGPCEFCRWPSQIELNGGAVRGVCVCVCVCVCARGEEAGISAYRTEACRVVSQAWFCCPQHWQLGIFLCSSGR